MLLDSVTSVNRLPMPGFPPVDVQRSYVGQAGTDAMEAAWCFYSLMEQRSTKYGFRLNRQSHVLDFGCGWGRHARMFLRDVPGSHIWLADTWDGPLDLCRDTGIPGQRICVPPMPPSPLPSNRFDLVFAYSVFSHLSPISHLAWRTELARCIKTGGLAFITTHARWFLDECLRYREHPEERTIPWHDKLAESFVDYDTAVSAYDRGEMVFASNQRPGGAGQRVIHRSGGGAPELGPDFYGDAVVPAAFFQAEWCGPAGFKFLDFVADRSVCEQAVAILRRT